MYLLCLITNILFVVILCINLILQDLWLINYIRCICFSLPQVAVVLSSNSLAVDETEVFLRFVELKWNMFGYSLT